MLGSNLGDRTTQLVRKSLHSSLSWQVLYSLKTNKANMTAATIEPSSRNVLVIVLLVAVFAAAIIDVAIPIALLDIANILASCREPLVNLIQ
jgi:hypothetical protein